MLAKLLVRAVERLVPWLPRAVDVPISIVAGTIAYLLSPGARRAVRRNLEVVVPERTDRDALVRRAFVAQVRHYLGIFRIARLTTEEVRRTIEVRGWEHFANAYATGKGVVMASAHLGPVSVCGQVFISRGVGVTMPIEKETSEVSRAVNRARRAMGLRFVETGAALSIGRILRRGGVLGILADRAVTGIGARVELFGRETLLPSAHVSLALRSGAYVVPAFAHHERGRDVAEFEAPLELVSTGDHDRDVREGVRRFAERLEPHIRRAPEEWSVFEELWER
ncbi:MAG: hypothetical protein HY071_05420 [Chloroflexi bacterium]|nr:hypothetical protein [Chloroflexota bacterium]